MAAYKTLPRGATTRPHPPAARPTGFHQHLLIASICVPRPLDEATTSWRPVRRTDPSRRRPGAPLRDPQKPISAIGAGADRSRLARRLALGDPCGSGRDTLVADPDVVTGDHYLDRLRKLAAERAPWVIGIRSAEGLLDARPAIALRAYPRRRQAFGERGARQCP